MVRTRRRSAPSASSSRTPGLQRLPSVGDVVEVVWDDRDETFCGVLGARLGCMKRGSLGFRFRVDYEDGDVVEHELDAMRWRFLNPLSAWIQPGDLTDAVSRDTADPSFYAYDQNKRKRARSDTLTMTTTTTATATAHANSENNESNFKKQTASPTSPSGLLGFSDRRLLCTSTDTTPALVPVAAYASKRVKDIDFHLQQEHDTKEEVVEGEEEGEEISSHHGAANDNDDEDEDDGDGDGDSDGDDDDDANVDDVVRLVNLDAMSESCTPKPKPKLAPLDLSDLVSPRGVADFCKTSSTAQPSNVKHSPSPLAIPIPHDVGNTTAHSYSEPWTEAWNCLRDTRVPLRKRLSLGHLRALADNR